MFHLSTPLRKHEIHTKSTKNLELEAALLVKQIESKEEKEKLCLANNTEGDVDEMEGWVDNGLLGAGWYGKGCAKLKKTKKRRKLK